MNSITFDSCSNRFTSFQFYTARINPSVKTHQIIHENRRLICKPIIPRVEGIIKNNYYFFTENNQYIESSISGYSILNSKMPISLSKIRFREKEHSKNKKLFPFRMNERETVFIVILCQINDRQHLPNQVEYSRFHLVFRPTLL